MEDLELNKDQIGRIVRGIPAAREIVKSIIKDFENAEFDLLHIDDMNLHGSALIIAYEQYCKSSLSKLLELVRERDESLIEFVNDYGQKHDDRKYYVVAAGAHLRNQMKMNNQKQKREVCQHHLKGRCKFGIFCKYDHPAKIRKPCKFFLQGRCSYGDACKFIHDTDELLKLQEQEKISEDKKMEDMAKMLMNEFDI